MAASHTPASKINPSSLYRFRYGAECDVSAITHEIQEGANTHWLPVRESWWLPAGSTSQLDHGRGSRQQVMIYCQCGFVVVRAHNQHVLSPSLCLCLVCEIGIDLVEKDDEHWEDEQHGDGNLLAYDVPSSPSERPSGCRPTTTTLAAPNGLSLRLVILLPSCCRAVLEAHCGPASGK